MVPPAEPCPQPQRPQLESAVGAGQPVKHSSPQLASLHRRETHEARSARGKPLTRRTGPREYFRTIRILAAKSLEPQICIIPEKVDKRLQRWSSGAADPPDPGAMWDPEP